MPLDNAGQMKTVGCLVERRYAEALADIWEEMPDRDLFRQEIETVRNLFADNRDLGDMLVNPCMDIDSKKETIDMIFTAYFSAEICNFLKLLADKGRSGYLPGIAREFISLADGRSGILRLAVTSSLPLDPDQTARIGEIFGKKSGAGSVRISSSLDSSLLGGVKVAAGGSQTDGSVKKRLEELGKILRCQV